MCACDFDMPDVIMKTETATKRKIMLILGLINV